QITELGDGSNSFCAAAINGNRNHAVPPRAPRIVFAPALTHSCLDLVLFFLRHDFSSQTFSDEPLPICNYQLPFLNRQSAIGSWQSAVADGLRLSHQVFALRQTKSEETEVSSWIDLIAFARSGAILSTFIFSSPLASSRS